MLTNELREDVGGADPTAEEVEVVASLEATNLILTDFDRDKILLMLVSDNSPSNTTIPLMFVIAG